MSLSFCISSVLWLMRSHGQSLRIVSELWFLDKIRFSHIFIRGHFMVSFMRGAEQIVRQSVIFISVSAVVMSLSQVPPITLNSMNYLLFLVLPASACGVPPQQASSSPFVFFHACSVAEWENPNHLYIHFRSTHTIYRVYLHP